MFEILLGLIVMLKAHGSQHMRLSRLETIEVSMASERIENRHTKMKKD
jgi:hypothetical protein